MLALGKTVLGRDTDAEAAVKDTFILIWKHAESYDSEQASAEAWIYSIFRHRLMNTLRQPGRIAPPAQPWTDHLSDVTADEHTRNPVCNALQRMDREQRRPLLLAYFHGCNYRQIATLLGGTADQVRRQVRQILRELSRQYPQ